MTQASVAPCARRRLERHRLGLRARLRNPNISDLKSNPGRYQDRTVNIDGVVTSSWGVPLVPFRMYKVDDGTGEVTVLSQGQPDADPRRARARQGPGERGRGVRRPVARPAPARGEAGYPAGQLRRQNRTLDRDRRHVVVRRRVAAEFLNRGEDRVDDLARGLARAWPATTVEQPRRRRTPAPAHRCASKTPSVQNTNTSPAARSKRDLVVGRAGKRSERHAGQLDLLRHCRRRCRRGRANRIRQPGVGQHDACAA